WTRRIAIAAVTVFAVLAVMKSVSGVIGSPPLGSWVPAVPAQGAWPRWITAALTPGTPRRVLACCRAPWSAAERLTAVDSAGVPAGATTSATTPTRQRPLIRLATARRRRTRTRAG